jgi:hypothetical protein
MMSHEPVTIRTYQTQPEAEADRMHLEAAGFTAVLNDSETVGMNWMLGTALGAIKLQVPESQARAALALLEKGEKAGRKRRKKRRLGRDEAECLSCGAPMRNHQTTCPSCGWSYQTEEVEPEESNSHSPRERTPDLPENGGKTILTSLRVSKRTFFLYLLSGIALFLLLTCLLRLW